jgi:hypothetical protein
MVPEYHSIWPSCVGGVDWRILLSAAYYLQDPIGCDRRVVHRNPHIIQPEVGQKIMTDGSKLHLGIWK